MWPPVPALGTVLSAAFRSKPAAIHSHREGLTLSLIHRYRRMSSVRRSIEERRLSKCWDAVQEGTLKLVVAQSNDDFQWMWLLEVARSVEVRYF